MITLDEIKQHLHIEDTSEDVYLQAHIAMAEQAVRDYCKTSFDDDVPESVRLACILFVAHFYTYRENADEQAYNAMMSAFHTLLYPNRNVEMML